MGRGPDVTSNSEHNDSVVRILLAFSGKAEEVARKIASQELKGDVATQQTYRGYYASCHTDFI